MSEESHIQEWLAKGEAERVEKDRYRAVVDDLLNSLNQHAQDKRWDSQRSKAMLEIMSLSIRYAHSCAKSHEGSAGMRSKLRSELREELRRWCSGGEHG